ncbi:1748_t:CDS:1 [Funneliformis caledonium]|uniref:1748_t:CDS:1 n=1 Tax=Funneliformis caledonium TaxID=1117310 RepID=A0A9N8ZEM9_9GLOM|nr:1748_t:CDS:1 [Funneliformis caledonium]
MDIKHNENEEITNFWNVYDVDLVHQKISQFLTSYIYELISKADQDGRNNPDIASRICYNFASSNNCQNPNCRMYHIVPTPLLLFQRLKLARLQYTVVRQLDVLCRYELHNEEINNSQKWWAETLVKCHMCYQSPQTSCPEVTRMVLNKLSVHIRDDLINDVYKIWLFNVSKDADNFEVMLKRLFVIQQLQDKKIIDEFYQEMSKTKILSHPSYLPVGFEYYCGIYQMIPVGRHLALFFSFLHTNKVIHAITSSGAFINYAIKNIEKVNLASSDALGELAFLMEFTTSLIFAVGQEYCDFCLPRSYLINYFDVFTVNPLIPGRTIYSRKNYLSVINNSIDQVQQLLDLLFCKEEIYLPIILRLLRLLVLINLNETTFTQKILNLFKHFFSKNKIFSIKIKTYLEENRLVRLVAVLHNDLREMRCDSLVIVRYQSNSISKFAYFEKYDGIKNLTYNSIGKFRSSLRKIISSATGIPVDQLI